MAVRRTLKQKQQAVLHRQDTYHYTLPSATGVKTPVVAATPEEPSPTKALHQVFGYDPQLLLGDVRKTVITTLVITLVLVLLTYTRLIS